MSNNGTNRPIAALQAIATCEDTASVSNIKFVASEALAAYNAQANAAQPGDAYVVVQEGGSSGEHYIHSSDSLADAEDFRTSCEDDGGYRTTAVIVVPAALAAHGEQLYELLEEVRRADYSFPSKES